MNAGICYVGHTSMKDSLCERTIRDAMPSSCRTLNYTCVMGERGGENKVQGVFIPSLPAQEQHDAQGPNIHALNFYSD